MVESATEIVFGPDPPSASAGRGEGGAGAVVADGDGEDWTIGAGAVFNSQAAANRWRRPCQGSVPSWFVTSMWLSCVLIASTALRIKVTNSGVRSRSWFLIWFNRLSAPCVTASSVVKCRKPQVPLMVWNVRKILPSKALSVGRFSSSTSSCSRRVRCSLLSITKSLMISTTSWSSMADLLVEPGRTYTSPCASSYGGHDRGAPRHMNTEPSS
jgi:hypothetical protein